MRAGRMIQGVIFSDLGQGATFMALDWVQQALQRSLGYYPFPATLNLRPRAEEDARTWEAIQTEVKGIDVSPAEAGFCSARLFLVDIDRPAGAAGSRSKGAVLLPEVAGYPNDKIEVVSPRRLKDELGVRDGDCLTLEFVQ